jgi:hypothetical protein
MEQNFRVIIKNDKIDQQELIVLETNNFTKCRTEARNLISKGVPGGQVDILGLNPVGLWVSIWSDEYPGKDGNRLDSALIPT